MSSDSDIGVYDVCDHKHADPGNELFDEHRRGIYDTVQQKRVYAGWGRGQSV